MSRNFELLQNLGKEQDVFQAEILESHRGTASAAADGRTELAPLTLAMDEAQRDELAKLVQRLFLVPGMDAPRVVVVSGTESGSGCSWVWPRMAEMLASQVSASVCVVDANFSAPGLHREYGTENVQGLSDALRDPDSIRKFARPICRKNLWLLSSGADSASGPR